MPAGLATAINTFLASAALLKARGELPGSVSMLVHTSGLKADHRPCAGYVRAFLQPLRTTVPAPSWDRSDENPSEPQPLMRLPYAVSYLTQNIPIIALQKKYTQAAQKYI